MALPKDPFILFSVVNTKLRDMYSDLDSLCEGEGENEEDVIRTLSAAGFEYDEKLNRFV